MHANVYVALVQVGLHMTAWGLIFEHECNHLHAHTLTNAYVHTCTCVCTHERVCAAVLTCILGTYVHTHACPHTRMCHYV